ncbi:DUF305 domain-containing protein [Nocardioides nitrophenolicus]|uniref:DUF305 domain-containing protein n=1 Tax=Nocardioides nitrophenolicus TaxID=60489 RepID=UPI00195E7B3A|nr:DUF305 domain-containing protein [Nocardioides nitrophenolicus]MBM7516683.1 uncharacterized protein (DUF305 family) [Nocardioides nitrophenolicus]
MSRRPVLVPGLLLGVLALGACSSEPATVTLGGTAAAAESAETVERPWGTVKVFPEMEKAEEPGVDDVVFARDMVMHHEQAIELGTNLLGHDALDERVAATARFIVADQQNEIGVMNSWLDAWEASAQEHDDHGTEPMPGMLPQDRVDAIASLPSAASQVAFLVAMIEHHQGAITMSQDYLPVQANSFTRSSAQHIITEQLTEIQYMENVIDDLCAGGGPATCPTGAPGS